MSDSTPFGFGKFVPGFDFLQNLAQGTAGTIPKMPSLGHWVAPTLSVEELDKRIEELKAVQFWLEQNARALTATVQALEVQKMTLATLQGMNVSMADMAAAFTPKASGAPVGPGKSAAASAPPAPPAAAPAAAADAPAGSSTAASGVDPMQWWGALTQQFQQIATSAMQEASKQAALAPAQNLAAGMAQDAMKAATDMATQGVQTLQSATRRATRAPAEGKAATAKPAAKAAAGDAAPAAKKSSPRRTTKPAAR